MRQKVKTRSSSISFWNYHNFLVLTVGLTPLVLVLATTNSAAYELERTPNLDETSDIDRYSTSTETPSTSTETTYSTSIPTTTDALEGESSSSSLISSSSEYDTSTKPSQFTPHVQFEQEVDSSLNYTYSATEDTIEVEYKAEINPVTFKEQRIILANLSRYEEKYYRCYIITCSAQYPVQWVTNIPFEIQSSAPQENQECRFGDQWVYSMWNRDESGIPDNDSIKAQVGLHWSYKIRLSFKITEGISGRIKCQSLTDHDLFTDYYVYATAGPMFVNYDGDDYTTVLESFWQVPPVVGELLFDPNYRGNIYDNVQYFFENKIHLEPEFSALNDSFMFIPVPSNYPPTDWFLPQLGQQGAKIGALGSQLEYSYYCIVPFEYIYKPSIGFIFDDLNFLKTFFLPDCSVDQFVLKKVQFANFQDAASVNVHVTGNSTERLELTRAFLDMLPLNAEKGVDYNYLLGNGDGIEDRHFKILPCNFQAECEILKSTLNQYRVYSQGQPREMPAVNHAGNSTNNSLVSGLMRSFKFNGMLPSYEFFFTGLGLPNGSPRRYLLSENFPKGAVITLTHIPSDSSTVGLLAEKQFRCEISNFVLINNIKIYKFGTKSSNTNDKNRTKKIETLELLSPSKDSDFSSEEGWYSWDDLTEIEGFNPEFGSTFVDIFVNITDSDSKIIYTAPWQNSTEIITETIDIRLPNVGGMRSIKDKNDTIYFKKGKPIQELVCVASGAPKLSVSWVIPKCELRARINEIKNRDGESTLQFLPPFEDNQKFQGEYVCEVRNDYGIVNVTTALVMEQEDEETIWTAGMSWELGASLGSPPVIIFLVTIFVRIHRYRKAEQRDITEEEVHEFLDGQLQSKSSSSGFHSISENDTQKYSSCYNSNVDVSMLPLDPKFIIPEDALIIEKTAKLGEGYFGIVYRGRINAAEVAVKSTKEHANVSCVKAFLEEIKIMAYVAQDRAGSGSLRGKENIVNFIGVVINRLKERLVYAVVELSPIGSLDSYLQTIREKKTPEFNNLLISDQFITYISAGLRTPFAHVEYTPKIITTMDLVHWCGQIAAGMNYLALKRVIHGDLATRNVLVFPHNVVKITDFGLSKKLYAYSEYVRNKDKKVALPWAWMALECLQHNTFSTESDIWSFGVTMWEIFSIGQFPYPGYQFSNNFVSALSSGMRMGKPTYASSAIYNQMWNCWNSSSKNRPSFAHMRDVFEAVVQKWIADVEAGQKQQNRTSHVKKEIAIYIHSNYV